jgi:hypothetical protein
MLTMKVSRLVTFMIASSVYKVGGLL